MDYVSAQKRLVVRRLSFPGLFPVGELEGKLEDATLSLASSASVKAKASWTYLGDDLRSGDVVRLACAFDDGRDVEEVTLATLACYSDRVNEQGSVRRARFDAYGLAKKALDARYWAAYSVARGSDAVDEVAKVLSTVGLRLAYRPDGTHPVRSGKTYFPEDFSKLDIVNDLLEGAGYLAVDTDERGLAVLRRSSPTPSWSPIWLAEGPGSVIEEESEIEREWSDIANVVICVVDGPDEEAMRAVAVNDDPADPTSTVARGEVARVERLNDIESCGALSQKAHDLLREERSRLEAVKFACGYAPLRLFGPVGITKGSINGVYTVQSLEVDLRTMRMQGRARRYV